MIGKHIMAMEARAVFETMKAHKDVHIIPVYDQIYIFADKETAETVIDTFYNNVKKYMGWKDISKEEAFRIEDNNIQEAGFVFENKEQEEGNKEQRAIILVSKAKSPKMLAYLQRKTIHKWFDFGQTPIRI
jgi:hypothetical protein